MKTKAFKDDSIFTGWREFKNTCGQWFRAEYKGCGIWDFYRGIVDSFGREAFFYVGTVLAPRRASCATIYSGYDDGGCAGGEYGGFYDEDDRDGFWDEED